MPVRAQVAALCIAALAVVGACSSTTPTASSSSSTEAPVSTSLPPTSTAPPTTSTTTSVTTTGDLNAAGDIPDNQVFVPYTFPGGVFTVKVPEGWSQSSGAAGDVVFTDNFNSISLSLVDSPSAPTVDSARSQEVPQLQQADPSIQISDVTTVSRHAGDAVHISYQATSAPNAVTGKTTNLAVERYEFWRNGKEAILTLAGPVGADNVDPWRTVTDSFSWA